jgi:hypothetical protein
MIPYYSKLELLEICRNARTIDEIIRITDLLKYLWALGENINLDTVKLIVLKRIKELA